MADVKVRRLLINMALNEKPSRKLAKILAFYYPNIDLSDKKALFESLLYYYKLQDNTIYDFEKVHQETSVENELDSLKGKDYRIKSIEISNVRGIPEKDESGISFGIDFTVDESVNNAIILANNGTGKSSIFSALEMIFTQEISEKQLRTHNSRNLGKSEYDKYLLRFPKESKPYCSIRTNEGTFDFDTIVFENEDTRALLNPSNHFVSDYDIYHYGQKEYDGNVDNKNSFHSLIADSLGLGEFIQLQSILKEVAGYGRLTESAKLKKLEGQRNSIELNIRNYEEQIRFKKSKLEDLRENGSENESNFLKNDRDKTKKINEWLNKVLVYNIQRERKTSIENDFLNAGLELIHEFDNCPFCQNSKKTLEDIQREVEIRLQKLRDLQQLDEELRQRYRSLTEVLVSFYRSTLRVYEEVSKERSETSGYSELKDLSHKEEVLYVSLSPSLHDEELIDILDVLNQKAYPNQKDYKKLFDLVNQTKIKSNAELVGRIRTFLIERRQILERVKEENSQKNHALTIEQQILLLEEEIKTLVQKIVTSEEELESIKSKISSAENDVALVKKIKSEINEFIGPIDSEINKFVNEAFEPIQDTVEAILKDYLKNEAISFKIERKENKIIVNDEEKTSSVIIAIIECYDSLEEKNKITTPDNYFNTFRYKLFCLMVSLSLALATRRKYKVNLPLVIDDIFFASDFESKNSFSEFLQKVIKIFNKYTPDLPLQFILFTHDDLIFRSAMDAVETFKPDNSLEDSIYEGNKASLAEKTLIGRFFNPSDKEKCPSILENGKEYWSLLYRIPKTIEQLINE
jgi:hypothetical protein